MVKHAFPPIVDENSKILILGTMPGEKSLQRNQYYAHKNNQFWKIIFILFQQPLTEHYDARKAILLKNHIALWDVLKACEGEGSSDKNIMNAVPNDFVSFYKRYPKIKKITLLPATMSGHALMSCSYNVCFSLCFIYLFQR